MALVDGGDKGRFDGSEGCFGEVYGELGFVGFIADNTVGLAWMGTCR